ncbi:MAG TPA: hypothetical protein VN458_01625 [Solirubrobacterales bacterium]|nr:hypothetical protein [Solirubrobacterales bacterium]
MTTRRFWAALIGAATALLLTAPGASALTTVSATGADRGDGVYVGKARCPGDKRVVSGGFTMPDESEAVVNKAKGKRSWIVKGQDTSGPLEVFAYCSGRLEPSTASDRSGFSQSNDRGKANARCGHGKTAVSGGWKFDDLSGNQPVFKSFGRGGRSWRVHAFSDESERITAYAYCLRRDVKTRSKRGDPIPDEGADSTRVKCHRGDQLLSGGFNTKPKSDFSNDDGPDFFYSKSSRVGKRGWRAAAHNYSSVSGRTTVTAICV